MTLVVRGHQIILDIVDRTVVDVRFWSGRSRIVGSTFLWVDQILLVIAGGGDGMVRYRLRRI
jgi:hypothetical protein